MQVKAPEMDVNATSVMRRYHVGIWSVGLAVIAQREIRSNFGAG